MLCHGIKELMDQGFLAWNATKEEVSPYFCGFNNSGCICVRNFVVLKTNYIGYLLRFILKKKINKERNLRSKYFYHFL
jgi:hypothetical protein